MRLDGDSGTAEWLEQGAGTLPSAITRLLGRNAAVDELTAQLSDARLLTLCGPGGIGKTRLALALAEAVCQEFAGGAWWVDLSSTFDPDVVAEAVAATLLPDGGAADPLPALAQMFAEPTLLILDNCEQVTDATAEMVASLLQRAPALRTVATSRQPLGTSGERVWRVPGLDGAGIELFVDRACEALSTFTPDADGVRQAIAVICQLLDGVPLAIELAAARVPVLDVSQIAERLEQGTQVLGRGPRVAPKRHQTLRGTLDWSHHLLSEAERILFRRLGVFRGSFSLEGAESVCIGGALTAGQVLEPLARLVDQSLVQVQSDGDSQRYRLLGTVHEYALERLGELPDELVEARRRHAHYFHDLTHRAGPLAGSEDYLQRLQILEAERDNLGEALDWELKHEPGSAAAMASELWPFWYQRGNYREARAWLEQALAVASRVPASLRSRLMATLGEVEFLQCEYERAAAHLEQAVELISERDDPRLLATALQRLGAIAREQARYDEARGLHGRSLEIWQELDDLAGIADANNYLGFVEWLAAAPDAGRALCATALDGFEQVGDPARTASTLVNLGACELYAGELDAAAATLERALTLARRIGFQEGIAWSLHELAIVGRRRRRPVAENVTQLREALEIHRRLGDRWRTASVLEEIAGAVLVRADPLLAVELLAVVEAERQRLGAPIAPAEQGDRDSTLKQLARRLNVGGYEAAWSEGAASELEAVMPRVMTALQSANNAVEASIAPRMLPSLTGRELAVLQLVSEGQTNSEIAAALYISSSTAGVHVSNILRKLGAKRRVDAARIAHQLGLLSAA